MGSDNLVLLPQTRRLGQHRELPSSTPAYSAYGAYGAYVDFGMTMRSRRKTKTGCYRVLAKNVAIPMTNNHPESPFAQLSMFPDEIRADRSTNNFRLTSVSSAYIVQRRRPRSNRETTTMQLLWECQFPSPIPNGART